MTSAGRLEELDESDGIDLQEFISQFAGLLYRYANGIRPIKNEEALYIVTGCIKSESWALAAFRDPVLHPQHVPRLVKLSGGPVDNSAQNTIYGWRSPGTFDSYVGKSEANGSQDQTLFLRGFKLDFSQSFRSQAKRAHPPFTRRNESDGDSSFGSPDSKGSRGGQTGGDPSGGGEGSSKGSWGASGDSGGTGGRDVCEAADDYFLITSFPDQSKQEVDVSTHLPMTVTVL